MHVYIRTYITTYIMYKYTMINCLQVIQLVAYIDTVRTVVWPSYMKFDKLKKYTVVRKFFDRKYFIDKKIKVKYFR